MPEPVRRALDGRVYMPDARAEDLRAAEEWIATTLGGGVDLEVAAGLADSPSFGYGLIDPHKA